MEQTLKDRLSMTCCTKYAQSDNERVLRRFQDVLLIGNVLHLLQLDDVRFPHGLESVDVAGDLMGYYRHLSEGTCPDDLNRLKV